MFFPLFFVIQITINKYILIFQCVEKLPVLILENKFLHFALLWGKIGKIFFGR